MSLKFIKASPDDPCYKEGWTISTSTVPARSTKSSPAEKSTESKQSLLHLNNLVVIMSIMEANVILKNPSPDPEGYVPAIWWSANGYFWDLSPCKRGNRPRVLINGAWITDRDSGLEFDETADVRLVTWTELNAALRAES